MRKKCLILSGIGFLIGLLVGNLIAWLSDGVLVNEKIAAWIGSDVASVVIQSLLSGLLGAISMGSAVIHEIENWSLARCATVHYLLIETAYTITALLLGWVHSLPEYLITVGIQLVIYIMIWLIMYFRYKVQIRELNVLLSAEQTETADQENRQK